jgi:hypothetical protein
MLRIIESFMTAHQLPDVTVVADAGMVSEGNQKQIEAAGLSFILAMKIPRVPYVISQCRREQARTGAYSPSPGQSGRTAAAATRVIYYQYRHGRARRALRGIDEQVATAERPSRARPRSSGTGSSSSPAAPSR